MKRPRDRRAAASVVRLEDRRLLSASGTWLGQDAHDLVGTSSIPAPDGVQDIHIAISGLPSARAVTFADVRGLGGDDWQYNGPYGPWAAALVRTPGATTADLYIEPARVETGRPFEVVVRYDDGSSDDFWLNGGNADPNLRMPAAALQARWLGQDGQDWTGPSPAVGPDGIQDVHLALTGLASTVGITSVIVDGPAGDTWQFGLNHAADKNAELFRVANDPTTADLYFSPDRNLVGQGLQLLLVYANGKTDATSVVAGPTDPGLAMPATATPTVGWGALGAGWLGQDGWNLAGRGSVHVALAGLPSSKLVVAAMLDDGGAGAWAYQVAGQSVTYIDPGAQALAFRRNAADPTRADLGFGPIRNEAGATLTLRVVFADGTMTAVAFPGGISNPNQRDPGIASTSVVAHPGDDLNDLANRFGIVRLSPGTYTLDRPLVLNQAVIITAASGAVLLFSQGANDPAWTAAIKIRMGHTTLAGFSVRFAGPIRWDWSVDYGPAVIGTTDNRDNGPSNLMEAIVLSYLDLQGPPASSSWEEAPHLIRVDSAAGGRISSNVLKGGMTEFNGGPWQVVSNYYQGTVPGTSTAAAFAGHYTHDLVLQGNLAVPVGASGKTWRFLVLTQQGLDDLIAGNIVVGIGPRDDDVVPGANAAEVILTEAYRLHFEGILSSISADGRVVQIPTPQGGAARTGDVVAILSGPQAGQYRRVLQAISPTAYLLDSPIAQGSYAISIATGFVGETFQNNWVDCRGSSVASPLVLVGNHYGTKVIGNTLLGGGDAFKITAAPTEQPDLWGWSHAPFFGGLIANNVWVDSLRGGTLDVEHGPAIKSNRGRVYVSATVQDNTAIWTAGFLQQHARDATPLVLSALTVGDLGSIDPGELVVQERGDRVVVPAGYRPGSTLRVDAGTINGQAQLAGSITAR